MDLASLIARVRADFQEFPGMRLTARQAQRLWAIDDRLFEMLIRHGILQRLPNGTVSPATEPRAASHLGCELSPR